MVNSQLHVLPTTVLTIDTPYGSGTDGMQPHHCGALEQETEVLNVVPSGASVLTNTGVESVLHTGSGGNCARAWDTHRRANRQAAMRI